MGPEIRIDPDLCIGSGECVALAPDVFVLDDMTARVHGLGAGPLVDDAILACPTGAISQVDT